MVDMGSVGLLYVGAILFLNGLMLLGLVEARAAAPLNLFVGGLQVITPTYLIFTSGGDANTILSASGIYLFGFTYLYVGFNLLGGLDGTGLGWFSAFVAGCAIVFAGLNFGRFTGAIAVVAGIFSGAVPAFMLLTGVWDDYMTTTTIALAVIFVLSLALYPRLREPRATPATAPAPELREGETPGHVERAAGPADTPAHRRR
jgi:hypothetical protein